MAAGDVVFYPDHSIFDKNSENYLWIHLTPKSVKYSTPSIDSKQFVSNLKESTVAGSTLAFLAPMEIMENIGHTWESQENIITKMLGMYGSAKQSLSFDTEAHQINTALVYRNSERRKFDVMFNLSVFNDPYKEVVKPVEELRKYSAPAFNDETYDTRIQLPAVFKIRSKAGGKTIPLVNINYAALTSVQPSYKGPYMKGFPSHCELTLSFVDMEHLSKSSFESAGKVTVSWEEGEEYTKRSTYGGYNIGKPGMPHGKIMGWS